ncbi:hypothetical protein Taro_000853, partial [Colocasia esculenta]|nr:hypothetical protein [Colocasia esculenta]
LPGRRGGGGRSGGRRRGRLQQAWRLLRVLRRYGFAGRLVPPEIVIGFVWEAWGEEDLGEERGMASGFPGGGGGGGDIFGVGGDSALRSFPIPASAYQQRSRSDVGIPGGGGIVGGGGLPLPKRPLAELQRQQQMLQPAAFARLVRQKTIVPGSSPVSPLSPVDLAATSASFRPQSAGAPTAGCSVPPRNGSYLFLQQQLLLQQQQQQQRQQGHNRPYLAADLSFRRPLPAVGEQPRPQIKSQNATVAMKNKLQELEKQLLDDDDDNGGEEASASGSVVTAAEWSETMQNLLSPSSCSASSTLSPSPSSTCSSSSSVSSCRPPSRQLLLDAASAIADGNIDSASATLDRLQKASGADLRGDPDQRLTAYMVAALHVRISSLSSPAGPPSFPAARELCSVEHLRATRLLHESSPCFYLGFCAANLAILDATRGQSKIHIVDFDVGQGLQYAALVKTLAERPPSSGRPTVRITAVADPTIPSNPTNTTSGDSFLKMVGERIEKQAELAGVGLRFDVLHRRASDLDATALRCESDEALAVNLAFLLHRLPDESVTPDNPRDRLLRLARSLAPRVVTLVEPELSSNTAPFAARFAESLAYCGALFESLEATAPRASADRVRVEECLGRKAADAVAREGPDRVERCEVFGKWRARMGMAGYHPLPLGPAVVEPVRARFVGKHPGFTLKEEGGAVCLGWADRVLTVVSAWS